MKINVRVQLDRIPVVKARSEHDSQHTSVLWFFGRYDWYYQRLKVRGRATDLRAGESSVTCAVVSAQNKRGRRAERKSRIHTITDTVKTIATPRTHISIPIIIEC